MATSYTYRAPEMGPAMIIRTEDNTLAFVPCDLGNSDYQGFLSWLAEGNPAPEGWTGPTNATG